MADDLDSLVKGAPAPGKDVASLVGGTSGVAQVSPATATTKNGGDPLSHTPSSPSMIYLNLLILEASLRAQYLELRARKRHHTFFMSLLTAWIGGFGYALFFAPREDGQGVGGSVYWGVETIEKLCFMGGVITAILVWATGIWDRGIRWPRRWFAISNRGLRGFNCKLVIIRRSWWAEVLSTVGFFLTYGLFSHTASSSYRFVDPSVLRDVEKELRLSAADGSQHQHQHHPIIPPIHHSSDEEKGGGAFGHEEDLAPGGDYVKLLMLAKPFTPTFREHWELYRSEYWEKENERRALIRRKLKEREKELARQRWGLFWWLPWHKVELSQQASKATRNGASGQHSRTPSHSQHHAGAGDQDKLHPRAAAIEKQHRRRGSSTRRRSSTSSSRSPTPVAEMTPGSTSTTGPDEAAPISRKASSASNASEKKRKVKSSTGSISSKPKRPHADSRSVTPEYTSPLARSSSSAGDDGGSASAAATAATATVTHTAVAAAGATSTDSTGGEGGRPLRSSSVSRD